MTALEKYGAIGTGVVVSLLVAGLLFLRGELVGARGERDTARAQLVTATQAFQAEKASTLEAVADAQRLAAATAEDAKRQATVVAKLQAQADDYRTELRACRSPAALAKRIGNLFPATPDAPVTPEAP